MFVTNHKNIFVSIGAFLVVLSVIIFFLPEWGLKYGIDFTGGSILEVKYSEQAPSVEAIKSKITGAGIDNSLVQPSEENKVIIRTRTISDAEKKSILASLSQGETQTVEEIGFNSIGPTIGSELRKKSLISIVLVILAIVLFIAFAFRKVSKPVASWKYGFVALLALFHDIMIPTGVMVVLGKFWGVEIDVLFVTALLAVLALSISDTIVVFDRIRENLRHNEEEGKKELFENVVGRSINQTYARSINTSLTNLLVLVALFIFGSDSIHYFVLTMIIGMIAGMYSSIFVASPLLIYLEKWQEKDKKTS